MVSPPWAARVRRGWRTRPVKPGDTHCFFPWLVAAGCMVRYSLAGEPLFVPRVLSFLLARSASAGRVSESAVAGGSTVLGASFVAIFLDLLIG